MKAAISLTLSLVLAPSLALAADYCSMGTTPSNPSSAYLVHDDGTVSDPRTGLMWKRCIEGLEFDLATKLCTGSEESFNFAQALAHASEHEYASHTDWRVPNIKELFSLVDACRMYSVPAVLNAFNPEIFPLPNNVMGLFSSSPTRDGEIIYTVIPNGGGVSIDSWNVAAAPMLPLNLLMVRDIKE